MHDELHDIVAEDSTLGSVLLDNSVMHEINALLSADNFGGSKESTVFRAMQELYAEDIGIDLTTLSSKLKSDGVFDSAGGDDFLISLVQSTPHAYHAVNYAKIVKSKSLRRKLYETGSSIARDATDGRKTTDDLIHTAVDSIHDIMLDDGRNTVVDVRTLAHDSVDRAEERRLHGNAIPGVSTGLPDLDEMIGGYQKSHMIIAAGRPGSGKTTHIVNTLDFLSRQTGVTSLFFSLEMNERELIDKILAIRSSVNSKKLKNARRLTDLDVVKLRGGATAIRDSRGGILIDDVPERNMAQIMSLSRKYANMPGINLGLIVIDYVQLVQGSNPRDSEPDRLTKISRSCKILGKSLDLPVVAVAQLNRVSEGRDDHRPMMSDLKGSGSFEQDADIIQLLYRPDYWDSEDQPGILEIIVAKNRHGETGSIFTAFRQKFNQIISLGVRDDGINFRP